MRIWQTYDPEYSCITLDEMRAVLNHCRRGTPYYTYFLLRATTGIRGIELLEDVRLSSLSHDLTVMEYKVYKSRPRKNQAGKMCKQIKRRRVLIDPWVAGELRLYLNTYFLGDGLEYRSPWPAGCLFPWVELSTDNAVVGKMATVHAYWHKLRLKLKRMGFDSLRLHRECYGDGLTHYVRVVRPHMLRHFALCLYYYREGNKDIVRCRDWIKHSKAETTNGYLHPASALGTTEEYLQKATLAEIFGLSHAQSVLDEYILPSQKELQCFV